MPAFKYLRLKTLEANFDTLAGKVFDKHNATYDYRLLTPARQLQIFLIEAMFNQMKTSTLSKQDQKRRIMGAMLYVKHTIDKSYDWWKYIRSPKNSILFDGMDEAMGITAVNKLSNSKEKALMLEFRNYLLETAENENILRNIDSELLKKTNTSIASIAADISRFVATPKPSDKKIAKSQPVAYWKDEIKNFKHTSLKATATKEPAFTGKMGKDLSNPTDYMTPAAKEEFLMHELRSTIHDWSINDEDGYEYRDLLASIRFFKPQTLRKLPDVTIENEVDAKLTVASLSK